MIKLRPEIVEGIKAITSTAKSLKVQDPTETLRIELCKYVQNAIELEHATIPTYLTAMYSLKPGTNKEIREIIYSIVMEEMLHMTIAANILNALGGSPAINVPEFVPTYPGHLPMGIGDEEDLCVTLKGYSKEQVRDVFMVIEQPEKPIEPPTNTLDMSNTVTFATIGQFYTALQDAIKAVYPDELPDGTENQVIISDLFPESQAFFPKDELFPIITSTDAYNAIEIIKEQGEGTLRNPSFEDELAHYYKFQQLAEDFTWIKDDGKWVRGPAVPFNPDEVYPLFPNTKSCMLDEGSFERKRVDEFNASYQSLLNGLHETFNGKPEKLQDTIGLMFDVRLYAEKLCATPFPEKEGYNIGLPFEYVPSPCPPPQTCNE